MKDFLDQYGKDMKELEKCDQDKAWLLKKQPGATQNDIEMFQEKVSSFTISYGLSEKGAREEAYYMMTGIYF